MHYIWSKLGYNQYCTKLTFRGKNLGESPLKYNPVHNEYLANAYCHPSEVANAISSVLNRSHISFIHGYPSLIYDFARFCEEEASSLVRRLIFLAWNLLASEYPAPVYRETIIPYLKRPQSVV